MAGMIPLILTGLLRVLRTRRALVLENLALRHHLTVLQRPPPRPRLRTADRLLWSGAVSRGMGVAFAGTWSDVGAAELGCFIGDLLGRDTPATLGRHTQPSFYGPGW